ncbi:Disease resistance protein RPM1 [Morus notabilis]|uniref:Disease resistance protein RPM1 n=1 Tax=Morus notabilis TaxID=981085 RepID=W9R4T3_9ROSA|nr:disease resistance protein RPM1 [Morus notabilis]EXB54528.1 Disease resistance protein RPM1 [Morus notabilis]
MSETFLTPVIEKLVELLADEVGLLKGVHKEVKSLKDELEILQPFLKDAEAKSEKGEISEAAQIWLKQLREKADCIEDVVDEYLRHLSQRGQQQRHGFVRSLRKMGQIIKALKPRHDIASEIRDIKESLREIKERGQSYGLRPFEQGSSRGSTTSSTSDAAGLTSRLSSLFIEDDELVGIESTSKMLITSLVEEPSARTVISLVGEGGIGKTTLANKIFNDEEVKGHFDCHVWVTVSQSYDIDKILRIMKKKICPKVGQPAEEEIFTIEELISLLRQFLETKRYVVVFDDVWKTEFWDVIKHALPNNNNGSRIIVTARNSAVVDSFKETPFDVVHELKPWSSELAWELFCKNAFRYESQGKCPQELEDLSRRFVSKCQGLPLVIVAVAGLLSKKEKTKLEWRSVLDNLNDEFEKNPQLANVSRILSFSYHDLPYHLKTCLLYFAIFPEDYSILEGRLYTLWIAEGFIQLRRNKTPEQVAKEYLSELIGRNLVSFEIRHGIEKQCHVHDLIRDLILARVDEFSFCQILEDNKLRFEGKSRRVSIYGTTKDVLESVAGFKMRSLFLFNVDGFNKSFVVSLFERFKLLKVLDFEYAPLDDLPSEVGSLFHLKYLNLRGTTIKTLPRTIGKLQNLEVLNISQTQIKELPDEIKKLQNLRYLLSFCHVDNKESEYSFDSFYGVGIREGIGCLEKLLTLHLVEPRVGGVDFVKELEKLQKLKTLGIGKLTAEMGKALAASLEKMKGLEKLYAYSKDEGEILDLKGIICPPFLWHVSLQCRFQEFPDWLSKLENLKELNLRFSRLADEPLKWLKHLPNLVFLLLYKAYDGEELHFEEGGFLKLKQLKLRDLEGLKVMKIDKGALPLLEKFAFGPSPLMKEMPSGIEHLTNLKSLDFRNMSREFVVSLQPNVGPDYWKIKNTPSVTFWHKRERYKLGSSELLQRLQELGN